MFLALFLTLLIQEPDGKITPAYLDACIKKAVSGRTPEQLNEPTKQRLRQDLRGMLGFDPSPEKNPLNAQVTGRFERDGYAVEKIVYETFPQLYATAYLYLPAQGEKPYPVVVCPVGHWALKKLEPVVQARCIGLALLGFAVLCIDMPGSYGPLNDERNFPGSHNDWLFHLASLQPGGVMVWDVVRGLDYLETRPDIDMKRVGLTGASGGGFVTMYAGVIDDRVRCYVPVCYANSYEDNYDNGCFCNHVPGAMTIGDRSDVMALAAPKPILLIGAENDAEFPKAGMLRSHEKLKKHYAAAGAADRCEVLIVPGGHDYCKPMREKMYGFMRKHLMGQGDGGPIPEPRALTAHAGEPPLNMEDPKNKEVLCFPNGKAPADAKSLRQLALEKAQKLIAQSAALENAPGPGTLRDRLRERLLRIYPIPERVELGAQVKPVSQRGDCEGSYVSEPGLRIPFKMKRSIQVENFPAKAPARIIFAEGGINDASAVPTPAENAGPCLEMRIDGRGLGSLPGLEMKIAVYLGRPDVWMWAWDVSRAVDYLLTRPDVDEKQIEVWGFGPAGGQVAYLAALLDPRIQKAYGQRTLQSYLDAFERDGLPRFALPHRILEVGDLPLMRKALGTGGSAAMPAGAIRISIPRDQPAVEWATRQLQGVLEAQGRRTHLDFTSAPSTTPGNATRSPHRFRILLAPTDTPEPADSVDSAITTPEAYTLSPLPNGIEGRYADAAGGLYALLDLLERVQLNGAEALSSLAEREEHRPAIQFRAVNPFLSIPLADKDGKRDWDNWWFTDESFWRGYLDLLAKSRINWIDIHGMYDIQRTSFPNMWPYFVASAKYPDVGMEPAQARKNLAMLQKICQMAQERGIKIAIMNYTGGWNWPGCRKAPERPVEDFIEYTKEGLKQIVQGCPDLAMIGFRIGESGYGEDFYAKSYIAALEELGRPLPLYTRTWGAKKEKLMELGGLYPDKFIIEIKYNGEQMGPPWHVAGGRMAGWRDYSYQNYLFYPRAYNVIWQIRTNGTHRVFQWAGYEHIRECVKTCNLADSIGFCVEPLSTYYPLNDFLHKESLFRWEYERNPLWYLMWGRLAYDPNTPEDVFRIAARAQWGDQQGDFAYDLLQCFSRIVPLAKTQVSLGPDHRDHAPELEWGGSIRRWAQGAPFDTYFAMSPAEYAREAVTGQYTGRRTPLQAADLLEDYASETLGREVGLSAGVSKALDDLKLDARMVAALGNYYAARLRAAAAYALLEYGGNAGQLPEAQRLVAESQKCWRELAALGDRHYKPFLDTLRLGTQTYLWSQANKNFERDAADFRTLSVSDAPAVHAVEHPQNNYHVKARVWADAVDPQKDKQSLVMRAALEGLGEEEVVQKVNVLWKPFRSEIEWRRVPMALDGQEWRATVDIDAEGALYGLEVVTDRCAFLALVDGLRPYGVLNPWKTK